MKTTRETPPFTCKVLTGLQATSTSKVPSSDLMIRDISPPRAARALRAPSRPSVCSTGSACGQSRPSRSIGTRDEATSATPGSCDV